MTDFTDPVVETETLEWLKYAFMQQFPDDAGVHLDLKIVQDFLTQDFLVRIRADILAKKLPSRQYETSTLVSFAAPRSTWQMFKQRHAGAWWLRWLVERRPVEMDLHYREAAVTLDIDDYLTYPWQTKVTPGLGRAVRVAVMRDDWLHGEQMTGDPDGSA